MLRHFKLKESSNSLDLLIKRLIILEVTSRKSAITIDAVYSNIDCTRSDAWLRLCKRSVQSDSGFLFLRMLFTLVEVCFTLCPVRQSVLRGKCLITNESVRPYPVAFPVSRQ